jgi:hypothetical protein
MDPLRRFLVATIVLPELQLHRRNPATGLVEPSRDVRQFPLMLYTFSSAPPKLPPPTRVIWQPTQDDPSDVLLTSPTDMVAHVLLNFQTAVAYPGASDQDVSALRILMCMNQMDPTESTTLFRGASPDRYPAQPLPQIVRASPNGLIIAHYHVGPSILDHLVEDRDVLASLGINWAILPPDTQGLYLISHLPRFGGGSERAFKRQALEVRDGLLCAPSIGSLFDLVMVFSRWDVLIRPATGVSIPLLADSVRNLDNYTLTEVTRMARIYPNDQWQKCDPPNAFICFPLHLSPEMVLRLLVDICPVTRHQDVGKPGQLLVTFDSPKVAQILYGLKLPTSSGAISITCGSGDGDAQWEKELALSPQAPLPMRRNLLDHVAQDPARLCAANLMSLQPGNAPPPGSL